ncbi:MAG: hypothetical protein NT090_03300 [Acidobacteria bacterium]|nr:hypothetical protein [Acidobacteriota bacterium]
MRFSLAGFQVIIIGRFWVITEAKISAYREDHELEDNLSQFRSAS